MRPKQEQFQTGIRFIARNYYFRKSSGTFEFAFSLPIAIINLYISCMRRISFSLFGIARLDADQCWKESGLHLKRFQKCDEYFNWSQKWKHL